MLQIDYARRISLDPAPQGLAFGLFLYVGLSLARVHEPANNTVSSVQSIVERLRNTGSIGIASALSLERMEKGLVYTLIP
jgi:hypothetical protein